MSRKNKPKTEAGAKAKSAEDPKKDEYKMVKTFWYILLGLFILLKVVDLVFMRQNTFDAVAHGQYSILASKGMFIGYNVWAIILSAVNAVTLLLKQRLLFLISLLLLLIIFVYPFFT